MYKYHRADIHHASPLWLYLLLKHWETSVQIGGQLLLQVLLSVSLFFPTDLVSPRTTRRPPQLEQQLMPNAWAPGAPWALLLSPASLLDACWPSHKYISKFTPACVYGSNGVRVSRLNPEFCHWVTAWTWVNCLTALCPHCLLQKMGMIIKLSSQGFCTP